MLKKVRSILISSNFKRIIIYGIGSLILAFLFLFLSIYFGFWGKIPSSKELSELKFESATEVLSSDGRLIGKFYINDRQPIRFNQVPKHFIEALIATEDARFYEHDGIDYNSLFRVFFKSILLRDSSSGGGSTISQQLSKNLYPRVDYGRLGIIIHKIRESIIAKRIESIFSKEEVLIKYLNAVPFSDNTFGIESTAKKFFNKAAKELSLVESASLVAMLKATYTYNPRLFPKKNLRRRNIILSQMYKYGYLSEERLDIEKIKDLKLDYRNYNSNNGIAPYFRAQVQKQLENWCSSNTDESGKNYNPYTSGLKVHTTLNYDMQQLAEDAVKEHMTKLQVTFEKEQGAKAPWKINKTLISKTLEKTDSYKALVRKGYKKEQILDSLNKKRDLRLFNWKKELNIEGSVVDSVKHYLKFLNAGMIAIEPKTGAVRAWIGGIDFEYFKYDHVSQSKRQVGSTFKPIVYTAALENGMQPCEYIPAKVITYKNFDNWAPKNSSSIDPSKRYSVKTALSKSINTCAVKVLEGTGIKRATRMAKQMGVSSRIPQVPSMVLGTAELSLSELATVYTCFVNDSKPSKPLLISKINDKNNNNLEIFEPEKINRAFSETTRQLMIEYMKETVNTGTASRLRNKYRLKNDIAAKTGTTQNNKDGWFMGITPNLVVGTWVGADNHNIGFKSTKYGQGAHSALPVFALLMQKMNLLNKFDTITKAKFSAPPLSLLEQLDCPETKDENFLRKLFAKRKQQEFKSRKNTKRRKSRRRRKRY